MDLMITVCLSVLIDYKSIHFDIPLYIN